MSKSAAWVLFLVVAFSAVSATLASDIKTGMKEIFSWKQIDFAFVSEEVRIKAMEAGCYVSKNILPLGVEVWKDRVFITLPRWRSGTPATLTYVTFDPKAGSTSPQLRPYPNWKSNKLPTKKHPKHGLTNMISVFRVQADVCDRLWVMDGGKTNILGKARRYFNPQILIFNLNTNELIRKYTLKHDDVKPDTFIANINVDVEKDDCENAFAYLPDFGANGVVVYSLKEDASWRVHHNYFHFDPLKGDFNISGINYQSTDGVFSFALSKMGRDGYKTAYFHPRNSFKEFKVSTRILRDKEIASKSFYEYKLLGCRGPDSHASASFLDPKSGVIFYTQISRNGVGCWNSHEETYTQENQALVVSDDTFVHPNDLKVDRNSNLWVLTDRLPEFVYGEINPEEVSTRVFMAPVKDLIKGTVCERKHY